MVRPTAALVLALLSPEPLNCQQWHKIGGEVDPLGRTEPMRFVKEAIVIEPADSDLAVALYVFCIEEYPKAELSIRLVGVSDRTALGAARIDGGETFPISWWNVGETAGTLEAMGSSGDAWGDRLKDGIEAVLSYEPVGRRNHYFRLDLRGVVDRIVMCGGPSRADEVRADAEQARMDSIVVAELPVVIGSEVVSGRGFARRFVLWAHENGLGPLRSVEDVKAACRKGNPENPSFRFGCLRILKN